RFSGHRSGKFLTAIVERSGNVLEEVIARVGGKICHRLGSIGRRLHGCLGIGLISLRNFGQYFPREGVMDGGVVLPLAPLAADEKWRCSRQRDAPWTNAYDTDSTEEAEAGSAFAACSEALALATKSSVPQSAMASIANASYVETPWQPGQSGIGTLR